MAVARHPGATGGSINFEKAKRGRHSPSPERESVVRGSGLVFEAQRGTA
jgi:hypothetical protein